MIEYFYMGLGMAVGLVGFIAPFMVLGLILKWVKGN